MGEISFKRHRFLPDVIRYAVWLYFHFTMSLHDVEYLLAERGIDVTCETVRCWANKFGPAISANIRKARGRGDSVWHLDEMVVRIGGKTLFMWRAVDKEGEVLDVLVQKRRNKASALSAEHSYKAILPIFGHKSDTIILCFGKIRPHCEQILSERRSVTSGLGCYNTPYCSMIYSLLHVGVVIEVYPSFNGSFPA